MHARILLAALLTPAALHAQSLFHAPLPPQQLSPEQQAQQTVQPPLPSAQTPVANQQPATAPQPQANPSAQPSPTPSPTQPVQPSQANALPTAAAYYSPSSLPPADQVSLFSVKPSKPKQYAKNDKVQIIVNESSLQKFEQNTDDKKNYNVNAGITDFPDVQAFFTDGVLVNNGKPTLKLGAANGSNFKGDGSYERKDKFVAKISAIVTDVKPNGMLVLEARQTILSDKESQSMVVSGLCDPKDITIQNSVLSNQLANLVIKKEHAGDVKDTATKGWFPRLFDAISGN